MFRRLRTIAILAWAIALSASSPAASAPARAVPGELIVKYRAGISDLRTRAIRARLQAHAEHTFPFIRADHLRLPEGADVAAAIAELRADPAVEYAEPNYEWSALEVPNDPLFPQLWAMQNTGQTGGVPGADIRAVDAWDVFTGDPNLMIGVIDTGIDWAHPDLAANVWTNPGEIPGNGIDDDHNGYVDDVHGYDFVNNDGNPADDNGHGTHVAGTIAAVGNNGIGVVGVVWRAQVVGIKILSDAGIGSTATALAGIQYALRVGVRVTNNSWGGPFNSQALSDAIEALGADGQIFVAAAGNDALNSDLVPNYPSGFASDCIISVAATNANDRLATFSNYGLNSVDVAAPGTDILSLAPGGGYQSLSGTSMATPHVTGIVALAMGHSPNASNTFIKELVLAHAEPLPGLEGVIGSGARVNALLPVQGPDVTPPAPITDLRITDVGSNHVALAWTASGDNGREGRAQSYELRFSTTPIVDATTFAGAGLASGTPRPRSSGEPEQFELRGLVSTATYFIAIVARDRFGNTAPLSNVVVATTLPAPHLALDVTPVEASLVSGGTRTGAITLRNVGPGTLDFTIPTPGFAITTPLSLNGEPWTSAAAGGDGSAIDNGEPPASGGTTDGNRTFATGGPDSYGYRWMDNNATGPAGPAFSWADITQLGQVVPIIGNDEISAPIPIGFYFPFYGTLFTTLRVCTNGWLSLGDAPVPPWNENRPLPDAVASAPNMIAPFWDDLDFQLAAHAWTYNDGSRFIISWQAVPQVARGGPYTFQAILYPSGEIRFQYYSMLKSLNSATIGIQNASRTIGLTTVFNRLYVQSGLAIRYRPPQTWFSVAPASGRVAAGGSVDLNWKLDALGIGPRSLDGAIAIRTNDPGQAQVSIPVRLDVQGAADMATIPDTLDFGTSLVGNHIIRTMTAWNPGSEPLVVSGFHSSEPDLTVDPPSFTIAPQGFRALTLTLDAAADRTFDGTVAFATNDPDENPFRLAVRGKVLPAPVAKATVPVLIAALAKSLGPDATFADQRVVVENSGGSDLHWRPVGNIWIRPNRLSVTTPPGRRDTVVVRLESSDLYDGDYTGEFKITSDDPQRPLLTFPASIHVGVAPAVIRMTPRTLHVPASGQSVNVTVVPPAGVDPASIAASSVRLLRRVPASGEGRVSPGAGTVTFTFDRAAVQAAIVSGARVPIELAGRSGQATWVAGTDTIEVTRASGTAAPGDLAPLPDRLALRRQGPHPSGRPALELALPSAGAVDAVVFDAGGARVRTLARGTFEAGIHPLMWDGSDDHGRSRPAGVYFVRVAALGEVLTMRVVKLE
jgi:hypothetical protein